jgi:lysophospholipase L1-like esterase
MPLPSKTLRTLAALALAASFAITGAGCNKKSPTQPSTIDVLAFGDSLTFGIGATSGNGYVPVLERRIGIDIFNSGIPGNTTGDALVRLNASVLSRDPRIVIVLLGGNDLLQNVPLQTRIDNITQIVERIRADGSKVILVGVGSGALDPFNGALPDLASRTGSSYVPDIMSGIFGNPSLMSDNIHPNDAGYAIIADRIEPALRSALAAPAFVH